MGEPSQSLLQPDHQQIATPTHTSHHHQPLGSSDPDHDNGNGNIGNDSSNSLLRTPEQAQMQTPGTAPGTAAATGTGSGKPRGRPKGSKTRPRPRSPSPGTLARNPPPPPAPLYRGPYATIDDAIFALQLHCFTSGYGVSQMRGVREKLSNGKYDPEGPVIRKDFACDRGGREFQSKGTGQRKRESAKTGCGWRVAVRRLKREGDLWFMEVLQARHNHDATPQHRMDAIPSYRRWQRENNRGIRTAVNRLARAAQMPARTVAAYLRGEHADPELDRVDRQILRALSMGDQEDLPDPADQSATVFGIVARRPCIILRDGGNAGKEEQQQQQQLQMQQQQQHMQMQMQMQMHQGRQILPLPPAPTTAAAAADET
ncbi:hypothetical protein SLS62_003485 [Diatrype stigma]|uniref:FAR1 domain-containing protein n=1 Tax=Diatrype stigma TaxID=117547 RepID=A0AAN9UY86_9PEZI